MKNYFSAGEKILWIVSVLLIIVPFFAVHNQDYFTLSASLLGVTAILFNAKGNPFGQVLMIVFCIAYGMISYHCSYFGEMITYMCMTLPMVIYSLIAWLRHPFSESSMEVEVNRISKKEVLFLIVLTVLVTILFYFILGYFHTAQLLVSTFSVTTSFSAVYLTARRSPYFSLAYGLNDIVLILLWSIASLKNTDYYSVVTCFLAFLMNDIHCFYAWIKMEQKQKKLL